MTLRCLAARVSLSAALAAGVMAAACGDSTRSTTPPPLPDAAPPADAAPPPPPGALQIKTLSNRADLISGGDALVEIIVPPGSGGGALHVAAGGKDVSAAFAKRSDGRTTGLVTELADGPNVITADLAGGQSASLTITNHSIGGPIFSGPQVTPWICAVPGGITPTGDDPGAFASGLSQNPSDAQCDAPSEVKLYYRTTAACALSLPDPFPALVPGSAAPPPAIPVAPRADACFKPFTPGDAPADLKTTMVDGVSVPYIVRVERGTLNRGIYDIAVLCDPSKLDCDGTQSAKPAWTPTAPAATWNRKLLYNFGASTNQPRFQQRSTQGWPGQDEALGRGFMVAVNSMTDSLLNSSRVAMTETLMMMKEHIIDTYGELRFAMGSGCSGGSINQLTAASIYPGLLDGIQPGCTYPDSETTGMEVADCELLVRYYASDAWKALMVNKTAAENNAKQAAINGHLDQAGCRSWFNLFIGRARPGTYTREVVDGNGVIATNGDTNNCGLPSIMVYDPGHPDRARCTPQDHAASIWGKVEGTSRAPSTRDNVGIVYGFKALLAKAITAEEFVSLNENIGGADFDLGHTHTRSVADPAALEIAYKAGIVSDGRHLVKTPIIDIRGFDEAGIHYIWRSYALRARLDEAGGHGNHVLWRFPGGLTPTAASHLTLDAFLAMDKWLTTLRADTSGAAIEQRVVTARPAEGFDFCYLTIDKQFTIKVADKALCDLDPGLQGHSSPRQVSGGPLTENILKCQLKPFDPADFPGLDDPQLARLQTAFPDGVCDWTKPGIGQQPAISPLDFTAGPGGVALPNAPASKAN